MGSLIDIRARKGQRFEMDAIVDGQMLLASIDVQMIEVDGQQLQVAVKRGPKGRPPLLMFNGIGANWQLAKPFLAALKQTEAIIFDIPGVGGSPLPAFPYRPSTIARLAMGLVERLGHEQVDVAGLSLGGDLAQQLAKKYDEARRNMFKHLAVNAA
jgi:pimeloyl-ACP methyl ester carboxylesterase